MRIRLTWVKPPETRRRISLRGFCMPLPGRNGRLIVPVPRYFKHDGPDSFQVSRATSLAVQPSLRNSSCHQNLSGIRRDFDGPKWTRVSRPFEHAIEALVSSVVRYWELFENIVRAGQDRQGTAWCRARRRSMGTAIARGGCRLDLPPSAFSPKRPAGNRRQARLSSWATALAAATS